MKKIREIPDISEYVHLYTILSYDIYSKQDVTLIVRNIHGGTVKAFFYLSKTFENGTLLYADNQECFDNKTITTLLYQGFRYYALTHDCYMMHSSAVKLNNGECILFCGQSGIGKSTQAGLWEKYAGVQIINYDQNLLYFTEDNKLLAKTTPWGGKEDLYLDFTCPVRCLVLLEQGSEDVVKRLSVAEAYARIYLCNYLFPVNESIEKKNQEILLRIVRATPTYCLSCTKTENAVTTLKAELCL